MLADLEVEDGKTTSPGVEGEDFKAEREGKGMRHGSLSPGRARAHSGSSAPPSRPGGPQA